MTTTNINKLITDNLAHWSLAIQNRKGVGRGSSKKINLYGIKKLRELILELAVRGKLVAQDPNDEPASVLLERIAAEKAQLVKDKKIKKPKTLRDISEDEKPFELPEGWEWSRFPNVAYYQVGKTPATKNDAYWDSSESGIPWVSIADLNHFDSVIGTNKKISKEAADSVFKCKPVSAGTILMSFKLTVGKISILRTDSYHNEAIISIYPFTGIFQHYLFKILPSRALAGNTKSAIMGNTLNSESLSMILIPTPPENEQIRIANKVNELMLLCDQLEQQTESSIDAHNVLVETLLATLTNSKDNAELEQNWQRLATHFTTLFTTENSIDQLKQTVLQLAVMGKLVSQDPNDESASVLLKKIAAEKEQLIKDKKIKKQKPLPSITEDEKPFELPDGWMWCRLGSLTLSAEAGWSPRCESYPREGGRWGVLKVSAVTWGKFKSEENKELPKGLDPRPQYEVKSGDFLISRANTSELVARAVVAPDNVPENLMMSDKIIRFSFSKSVSSHYINLVNNSIFSRHYYSLVAGGTSSSMKNVSQEQVRNLVIALPPSKEEHRIIAKVDQLTILCDQLKTQIQQAQQTRLHLADAMVETALSNKPNVDKI